MLSGARAELFERLFADPEIARAFDDRATLGAMLDFERALACVQARLGIVPEATPRALERVDVERFDVAQLAQAAISAGNTAIPFVRALTALVAATDEEAARFVHWGATSQDVMDTAVVLQLRPALSRCDAQLSRCIAALAALAREHDATVTVARTWLQHALPTTFGYTCASWMSALVRVRARLRDAAAGARVLQFGGAAGTLASLGGRGLEVADALAAELDLRLPAVPWHAQRERFADVAAALGLVAGALGKIARDVSLLMQTEIAEVFEPAAPGRGGSSTLPHKRNPVACAAILAVAVRAPHLVATMLAAMPQEEQRGLGGWHAEWTALPELVALVSGALRESAGLLEGLEVDAARMRANLDLTRGLIFAEAVQMTLGAKLGRLAAHEILERASKRALERGEHLLDILRKEPEVTDVVGGEELAALFEPERYLGAARAFVARALEEAGA